MNIDKFNDPGRGGVTAAEQDMGAFKTPSLRGVTLRPFLLHNGGMKSIREVINYYNTIDRSLFPGIDARLEPLHLTADEIDDLIAFLGALTPDPKLHY
jgi:cytochrome c peroxidase